MNWYGPGNETYAPPPHPLGAVWSALTAVGGRLYALGGLIDGVASDSVYSLDPSEHAWVEEESLPAASSAGSAVTRGGIIYALDAAGFWSYDPSDGNVEALTAPTASGADHPLAIEGGVLVCGLGTSDPEVYDFDTDTWSAAPGTSPLTEPVKLYAAVGTGAGTILMVGGQEGEGGLGGSPITFIDTVREYNVTSGAWALRESLPQPVRQGAAVLFLTDVLVIGGMNDSFESLATVYHYNKHQDEWTALAPIAQPGFARAAVIETGEVGVGSELVLAIPTEYQEGDPGSEGDVYAFGWEAALPGAAPPPPAWFAPGHESWVPAQLPAAREGSATAFTAGRFWLLAGLDGAGDETNTVWSYDLNTNAWTVEAPLSVAGASFGPAIPDGDWLYLELHEGATTRFVRYNTSSGVTEALTHHGVAIYHPLARAGDTIYHALASPSPQAYDLTTGSWSSVTGSPYADAFPRGGATSPDGQTVIVAGGSTFGGAVDIAYRYNPNRDAWAPLPSLPEGRYDVALVTHNNRVYAVAGFTSEGGTGSVVSIGPGESEWRDELPTPFPGGGTPAVAGLGRILQAGGRDDDLDEAVDTVAVLGPAPNVLTVSGTVEDEPQAAVAYLPVQYNITGGPGARADLPVIFRPTRGVRAPLLVRYDVPLEQPASAPLPTPSAGGGVTIMPPGSATPVTPEGFDGCDTYDFSHAFGGGATGTASRYADGSGLPSVGFIPGLTASPDPAAGWQRDADVTLFRNYANDTERLLADTILPELNPPDPVGDAILDGRTPPPPTSDEEAEEEAYPGFQSVRTGLYSLDAPLCSGETLRVMCFDVGVRAAYRDALAAARPTRRDLAQDAASEAGVTLVIRPGARDAYLSERVPAGYRTSGRRALSVLQDILLKDGAVYWFEDGALIVHPDGLPASSGFAEPTPHTPGGPFTDGSVHAGDVSVQHEGDPHLHEQDEHNDYVNDPPEPALGDYQQECEDLYGEGVDEETDPLWTGFDAGDGGDSTWETRSGGALAWTVRSGGGYGYTEVSNRVVKRGGLVVSETQTTRGWRRTPSGWQFTTLETNSRQHSYVPCCPDALASTVETVRVASTFDQAPGATDETLGSASGDAVTWWNLMPGMYLQSLRRIENEWHAEGWLRSRTESARTFDGFDFIETAAGNATIRTVRLEYNIDARTERNVPIGRGMWHQAVTTRETVHVPVRELRPGPEGIESEVVGSNRATATSSYVIVTDQAPPTVSCGAVRNPCSELGIITDPLLDCLEDAEDRFGRDHRDWRDIISDRDARRRNEPLTKLVQSFTWSEHRPDVRVGQIVQTTRGPGIIARVTWSGAGPRTGTPQRTTTAEVWSSA